MDEGIECISSDENDDVHSSRRVTRSYRKKMQKKKTTPTETINLVEDSPKMEKPKKTVMVDGWLELTLNEEDISENAEEIEEVKAIWVDDLEKIERFSLKKTEPLLPIFEHFAKIHNVTSDKILLKTNDFNKVNQYDSIELLNLNVTNFLIASLNETNSKEENDENKLEIKCLFKNRKPLSCYLHINQPFSFAVEQCANFIGCPVNCIKLYFDGEEMNLIDTPRSLDFEGGECIDVHMLTN